MLFSTPKTSVVEVHRIQGGKSTVTCGPEFQMVNKNFKFTRQERILVIFVHYLHSI